MPHGRIQPRTWYVKFGLAVNRLEDASEHLAVPPSDSEIQICIKDVIDMSNRDGRRIRRLQHISFAYKSEDPANSTHSDTTPDPGCNTAYIVGLVRFAHGGESILKTTMYSWIPNPRVIDQQWTPVHIQQGTGGNWWQHAIIWDFFSGCERGVHDLDVLFCKRSSVRMDSIARLAQRSLRGLAES